MYSRIVLYISFIAIASICVAQDVPQRKLHRNVTSALADEIAPAMSADGSTIIYMIREQRNPEWLLYESQRKGDSWTRGEPVDPVNQSPQIVHPGGYSLSPDGNRIYFTYNKRGGIGGYDIWYVDRNSNGKWGHPVNLAKPINSEKNDANPFISVDGRSLYFMRCDKLKPNETECCELMVAEKKGASRWGTPQPLPEPINKGCESTPRLMTDGRTLLFASKRSGGKGGLDVYRTQKDDNGSWSTPKPVDFLNTPEDDRFTAMSSNPGIVYFAKKDDKRFNLYEAILPESLRPLPIQHIRGKIKSSSGEPIHAFVIVKNEETGNNEFIGYNNKANGEFQATVLAGSAYDFSIVPVGNKQIYYAEYLDLTELNEHDKRGLFLTLDEVKKGQQFHLMDLAFDDYRQTTQVAEAELRRFYNLMNDNKSHTYEILVYDTVDQKPEPVDSIALREQYLDSLKKHPQTVYVDSLEKDTVQSDSLAGDLLEAYETHYTKLQKEREEKIAAIDKQLKELNDFAAWLRRFYTDKNISSSMIETKGVRQSEVPVKEASLNKKGIAVFIK